MLPQVEDGRQTKDPEPPTNVRVKRAAYRRWLAFAIALMVSAAVLASGIRSRIKAGKTLRSETSQMATTAVSVVSPKQTSPAQEIILPGNVEPFISSPIYARTNGYLMQWYFDIGAHVRQGQ